MRKTHTSKTIVLAALCCAFATACSGGGGMSSSVTGGTSSSPAGSSPATLSSGSTDTGIAGSVAAPGPNSFSSVPTVLAMSGGATFDGSSGLYPANMSFPLITNSLQASSTGLSAVSGGSQDATMTVVSASATSATAQLVIPSVGVNKLISFNAGLESFAQDLTTGLSYVLMGAWNQVTGPTSKLQSITTFVLGFETPQSAVPTSGTAQFSGTTIASAYKPVGTEIDGAVVAGNAAMSANFGSGAVTGSFTNMTANAQPWNNVSVNANITSGTNRFSGTTAAASAPGTAMSLSGTATGNINGAFYGPAAQQLGAVWSLSDGTGSAIGTVVAGH